MKNRLFTSIYFVIAIFTLAASANAQDQVSAQSPGRFTASFKTKAEPANGFDPPSSEVRMDSNAVHRVWRDKTTGTYFGYDVQIEPQGDSKTFKLSFGPLTLPMGSGVGVGAVGKGSGAGASGMIQQSGAMHFPEPQVIEDGDTVALDVLVNPSTGTKLIDLITVSVNNQTAPGSAASSPAREFSIDDVVMSMRSPQVLINGEVVASGSTGLSCTGEMVFFYLEGRGRFIFSIKPHDDYDFQRLGTIDNNKISFTFEGNNYEWNSTSPIVGNGGNWTLWVRHEPNYRPEMRPLTRPQYVVGAMDGVRSLRPQ